MHSPVPYINLPIGRCVLETVEDAHNLVYRQQDGKLDRPLGPLDLVEPRQLDAEHLAVQE